MQVTLAGPLAFAAAVSIAAGGLAAVAGAEDGAAPAPPVSSTSAPEPAQHASVAPVATTTAPPTTTTSTTTSTTTTTTVVPAAAPPTTAPAAPPPPPPVEPTIDAPVAPPADPYEQVPVVGIGRIKIPKVGLDHEIYEGVSLTVIDVGPGHWPGTPMPGGAGNVVLGGHRVTHSHPFRDLDQLVGGDEIIFEMYDGTRAVYRVTEQFVVYPDAMWIVDPTPNSIVTLFACHPKGSARQRIVVRAELMV